MANFLVQLALSGRQVIAETHSENLLLRVRALLLASKKKKSPHLTPDMVSILHINKGSNGESRIHQLSIDAMGQISNWPTGFMEEATSERIRLLEEMSKIHDTNDTNDT
jgi:predicted ATPase